MQHAGLRKINEKNQGLINFNFFNIKFFDFSKIAKIFFFKKISPLENIIKYKKKNILKRSSNTADATSICMHMSMYNENEREILFRPQMILQLIQNSMSELFGKYT